jgi:hypothetical protein
MYSFAPRPGLEPGTIALTGRRSTIELSRNTNSILTDMGRFSIGESAYKKSPALDCGALVLWCADGSQKIRGEFCQVRALALAQDEMAEDILPLHALDDV